MCNSLSESAPPMTTAASLPSRRSKPPTGARAVDQMRHLARATAGLHHQDAHERDRACVLEREQQTGRPVPQWSARAGIGRTVAIELGGGGLARARVDVEHDDSPVTRRVERSWVAERGDASATRRPGEMAVRTAGLGESARCTCRRGVAGVDDPDVVGEIEVPVVVPGLAVRELGAVGRPREPGRARPVAHHAWRRTALGRDHGQARRTIEDEVLAVFTCEEVGDVARRACPSPCASRPGPRSTRIRLSREMNARRVPSGDHSSSVGGSARVHTETYAVASSPTARTSTIDVGVSSSSSRACATA